jgi:pilus assembly protein Flp/PilA
MTMRNFSLNIARLFSVKSQRGVTAIEYGLLASLIALAIIVAVTLVGTNLDTVFNNIATKLGAS